MENKASVWEKETFQHLHTTKIHINLLIYDHGFNPSPPFTTFVICSLICLCILLAYIANNLNPDQTAALGAVDQIAALGAADQTAALGAVDQTAALQAV